jgi:hypothetical protein
MDVEQLDFYDQELQVPRATASMAEHFSKTLTD